MSGKKQRTSSGEADMMNPSNNDSGDSSMLRGDMKKSMFKAGEHLYRSVYNKPMQSEAYLCCYKLEKAPLLVLLVLVAIDLLRYVFLSYLSFSAGNVILCIIDSTVFRSFSTLLASCLASWRCS